MWTDVLLLFYKEMKYNERVTRLVSGSRVRCKRWVCFWLLSLFTRDDLLFCNAVRNGRFIVLQSSPRWRDDWLLWSSCVRSGVLQLLFCVSSSRCHGLVFVLLLRTFLSILTYFLVVCLKSSERLEYDEKNTLVYDYCPYQRWGLD